MKIIWNYFYVGKQIFLNESLSLFLKIHKIFPTTKMNHPHQKSSYSCMQFLSSTTKIMFAISLLQTIYHSVVIGAMWAAISPPQNNLLFSSTSFRQWTRAPTNKVHNHIKNLLPTAMFVNRISIEGIFDFFFALTQKFEEEKFSLGIFQ